MRDRTSVLRGGSSTSRASERVLRRMHSLSRPPLSGLVPSCGSFPELIPCHSPLDRLLQSLARQGVLRSSEEEAGQVA